MAKQLVNIGVSPNTGGDPARIAFEKVNSNNSELYTALGADAVTGILPLALPITKGGTGATTKEDAITNLGLGTAALLNVEDLPSGGGGVGNEYVLPKASTTTLGGIKVGNGLAIDTYGVLTTEAQGGSVTSVNGEVGEVVVKAENLSTLNGNTQQELNDRGGATWYAKSGGYALNARVILDNGGIVRSTEPNNTVDPNVDMTGWEVPSLKPAENLSDVPNKAAARSNLSVYSQTEVDTAISNATPTIPNATTTDKGIVQLNNTLTSTSSTQALTAAQGKVLQDNKLEANKVGAANGVASLGADTRVPVSQLPAATVSNAGVLRFATATEVANKTNVSAAVTPANVAAMIEQSPNATPTTPDATETTAGKAKIATTAIAQAGVNDADIITPKKLRDVLNATGGAPISACRAWVCFDSTTGGTIIRASNNIQSIVRTSQGKFVITFIDEMPHSDYIVLTGTRSDASDNSATLNLVVNEASIKSTQNAKKTKTLSVLLGNSVGLLDSYGMSLGVFC